jgi:hypothetical protein
VKTQGVEMELIQVVNQLHHQGEAILSLCASVNEDQARWKPDPENWSILEVLNHLLMEERLDFRGHLGHIYQKTQDVPPEIDRKTWKIQKKQDPRPMAQILLDFKAERETSIAWLNALENPDWEATISFEWGALSAGDLLASWLAHDLLHLRQLVALQYDLTARESQPFDVEYAGQW